jgi:hypothetical protein
VKAPRPPPASPLDEPARAAGSVADPQCTSGRCQGGVCVSQGCGSELPTPTSLAAARDRIAAGETDVALSSGGCWRYRRTLNGTSITTETILEAGGAVLTWSHTATESIGEQDTNRDGFFERKIRIVRGETANDERIEVHRFSSQTRAVIRRETYTRDNGTIHVLWERDDGSGDLEIEAEFDTTLTQILKVNDPDGASLHAQETTSLGVETVTRRAVTLTKHGITVHDCASAQQAEDLINDFLTGVGKGNRCMQSKGRGDIGNAVLDFSSKVPVDIICDPKLPKDVIANINSHEVLNAWPFDPRIKIRVNPQNYFNRPLENRQSTMWHEMLHLALGPHDEQAESSGRRREIDRVYACQGLCFNIALSVPQTKCSCARCLETNKCDARCRAFADCNADLGGWCPCPCRAQWYNSQADCAANCPSGLCCFAFSCRSYDVFCGA